MAAGALAAVLLAPAAALAAGSYADLVRAHAPVGYWRLGEADPAQFADSSFAGAHPGSRVPATGAQLLYRAEPGLPAWDDGAVRLAGVDAWSSVRGARDDPSVDITPKSDNLIL